MNHYISTGMDKVIRLNANQEQYQAPYDRFSIGVRGNVGTA